MRIPSLAVLNQFFYSLTSSPALPQCTSPSQRHEWRTLPQSQQLQYIAAVKCLQEKPTLGFNKAAKTRFDDFHAVHIDLADEVHLVAPFLPWHRWFLYTYEIALKNECGYTGATPYWDWSIDADTGSIMKSPVFDPVYGFGGNGIKVPDYNGQFNNMSNNPVWKPGTGGGCVTDGPFASYNLSLGPGTIPTNHCLQRDLNDFFVPQLKSEQVANTTKQPNFHTFHIEMEGVPITPTTKLHDGGHYAVGGEMSNMYSSAGDPLFYLHHANLDRIWWMWQQEDLKNRLYEISGRAVVDPPFVGVSLDFKLKMFDLGPASVTIRDVMDTRNELLCYTYV